MFAGVSYAAIVKQNCNKEVSKNNVKSSSNVPRKTGTTKSIKNHKVDNGALTKHARVTKPSKNDKSNCRLKCLHSHVIAQDTPKYNRFKVLQDLNENTDLDESNMNHNTSVSVNVKHVHRNVKQSRPKTNKLVVTNIGIESVSNITEKDNQAVITGKAVTDKLVLIETCDKYDLELCFKPKYRKKIQWAKDNPTLRNGTNK